jgi:hypothetical protein
MILALNGGGIRGALQVGALLEFPSENLLETFCDGVYGISVGAIIATYIAFGFTVADISEMFVGWSEVPLRPITIQSLKHAAYSDAKGLDDGGIILERMRRNFAEKKGMDFYSLRIADARIPLHIVATDVEHVKTVIFGKSMRVWDAVRSSISLPLIFTPHEIQGRLFIDGGILCSDISKCIPADDHARTLFVLTTRSIPSKSLSDVVISGVSSRAAYDIQIRYPDRTCLIADDDTPTLDMWSTPESVRAIIETGRAAMREFLSNDHAPDFVLGPSASIKNCSKVAVLGGPE